jgi:hypothetical protein
VSPRVARLAGALAIAAVAIAGCGGGAAPAELSPRPARMQDLVAMTTAQAARAADRIALVTAVGSRVVEGAPGTPFTRTRFKVERAVKGSLPRGFTIQVIGGRLGDRFVTSPVQAFRRGGRYILFLGPDNRVGPTIFPQPVIEVRRAGDADKLLDSLRRAAGGSP